VSFLRDLVELYRPDLVAALGNNGHAGLGLAFPAEKFTKIAHPVARGKQAGAFITGMDAIF
jgi:hypothetical protein